MKFVVLAFEIKGFCHFVINIMSSFTSLLFFLFRPPVTWKVRSQFGPIIICLKEVENESMIFVVKDLSVTMMTWTCLSLMILVEKKLLKYLADAKFMTKACSLSTICGWSRVSGHSPDQVMVLGFVWPKQGPVCWT